MTADREATVTQAFVAITDSLTGDFDVVELLSGVTEVCTRLLDVDAAGLLLADPRGVLHVLAASSERTRDLEMFQVQRDQGPCRDCYRTGVAVNVADLVQATPRWPQFAPAARAAGFESVHAVPMRLRETVFGALGLFGTRPGVLKPEDLNLAQAFAHVASVALVTGRAASDRAAVNEQLQAALTSRIVLEQAKGLLAQVGDTDMAQAFAALRRYARDHNLRLSEVAQDLVERRLAGRQILDYVTSKGTLGTPPRTDRPNCSPRRAPFRRVLARRHQPEGVGHERARLLGH